VTAGARRSAYGARLRAVVVAAVGALEVKAQGPSVVMQPVAAPSTFQQEARVDLFLASTTMVQGAFGGAWRVDENVRIVALGGAGSTFASGVGEFSARIDLLARYVLDPERRQQWALYGTGGLSVRYEAAPSWRGALVALVGLEGPMWGRWTPFVEAGYGGGVQAGFGVRRALATGR